MVTSAREHTSPLVRYQPHAAFLYSHAFGVGAIAGAVSLAASAFFGYDCLYPATVAGSCFCVWASAVLSQTPQQAIWNQKFRGELVSSLVKNVRKYLDIDLETYSHFVTRQEKRPAIDSPQSAKDGAIPPQESLAQDLRMRPVPEWVEVKRWPSVTRWGSSHPLAVQAFTNGTDLKYVAVNSETLTTQSGDIQINGSLQKTMEFLKNCFVALEDDGSPVFSLSYHTFSGTYKSKIFQADLLLRQKDCVWNICDTTSQTMCCTPFAKLSWRCSTAAIKFFDSKGLYRNLDISSDNIQYIKELDLYEINPYELELEPIHHSSGFRGNVSKFMWTVTLIRYNGPSGNHAQIVVEGINDGFTSEVPIGHYFVFLADLLGTKKKDDEKKRSESLQRSASGFLQGIVHSIIYRNDETALRAIRTDIRTTFDIRYEARSETWKRSSSSVKDMIQAIVKERDHPPPGFAVYGRHSIFASGKVVQDSCITWAIDKLALIEIILDGKTSPFFTNTSVIARYKPGEEVPWMVTFDPYEKRRRKYEIPQSQVDQFPCCV